MKNDSLKCLYITEENVDFIYWLDLIETVKDVDKDKSVMVVFFKSDHQIIHVEDSNDLFEKFSMLRYETHDCTVRIVDGECEFIDRCISDIITRRPE